MEEFIKELLSQNKIDETFVEKYNRRVKELKKNSPMATLQHIANTEAAQMEMLFQNGQSVGLLMEMVGQMNEATGQLMMMVSQENATLKDKVSQLEQKVNQLEAK